MENVIVMVKTAIARKDIAVTQNINL